MKVESPYQDPKQVEERKLKLDKRRGKYTSSIVDVGSVEIVYCRGECPSYAPVAYRGECPSYMLALDFHYCLMMRVLA